MLDATTKMALSQIVAGVYDCAIGLESTVVEAESADLLLDCPSAIEIIHNTVEELLKMVDEHIQLIDPTETFVSTSRIALSFREVLPPIADVRVASL